jgi:hypothetical protein
MSTYHVFLSHSSDDKSLVEDLARRLRQDGFNPYLDEWHLVPGELWQEALEGALGKSDTCAVFLGEKLGPWQNEEMRAALARHVRERHFRVIPVLLPGALRTGENDLPLFLRGKTWVDFRNGINDLDYRRLISGIRGVGPDDGGSTVTPSPPNRAKVPHRYLFALLAVVIGLGVLIWQSAHFDRGFRPIMRILPGESLIALLPSNKYPGKSEYDLVITVAGGQESVVEELELRLLCIGTEFDHIKSQCTSETAQQLIEEYLRGSTGPPGTLAERLNYWWPRARIEEAPAPDDGRPIGFELQSRNDNKRVRLAHHLYFESSQPEIQDLYLSENNLGDEE